jgi:hypothetical protein
MMRPGAEFAPLTVWQVLQSPVVCAVIARSAVPETTFTLNGVEMASVLKKLPAELTLSVKVRPTASVMTTCMAPLVTPLQSSGS